MYRSHARQPIKVGRLNLAAVTTDVRKTHVIGHDQNNVAATPYRQQSLGKPNTENSEEARHAGSEPLRSGGRNAFPTAANYIDPFETRDILSAPMKNPYAFTLLAGIGLLSGAGCQSNKETLSWAFLLATW